MSDNSKKRSGDPAWKEKYSEQVMTAAEAVAKVKPGSRVFIGTGCAQPQELVAALTERAAELTDTEIMHLLTMGDAPYAHKELSKFFRVNSFFISQNVRDIIQEGLGDYTPIFLSDIPRLFHSGRIPIDYAFIQVTPPDGQGRCSLGVSVDIVKSAAENAGMVVAEVNPRMPRTLGDSFISVFDIDVLVPVDREILEYTQPEPDENTKRIGEFVAGLIEDGSTMELGIGRIPHSVLQHLGDKKELGIHTEMLTDAIVGLVEKGVITGSRKSMDQGTKKLYDYIDNNPVFSFHPSEYVNDPFLISRQHKMVAINVALEVDLTGQVCADSLGTKFYSGIGGQVDFNRGAAHCPDGKAVIAMPATAGKGKISRIVTHLSKGAGVVTTRGDVHYVVTEYGVAYLHGKSVQERALALISISHPDFRAGLLKQAIEAKYVSADLANFENRMSSGPAELRTAMLLDDGTRISFRPVNATDEPRMKDLFYALTQETLYYRFMSRIKSVPKKQIQDFTYIDHRTEVALVGTLPEVHGDEIIAIGRYYLDRKTNRAEVAFIVHDKWQNRGVGSFLYKHLSNIARGNGIAGFTAEVLGDNRRMQAVFNNSGHKVRSRMSEGVYHFDIDL
jgi:acyl-CoA hydrolase/GNAT superfamily N-acetyltransferase